MNKLFDRTLKIIIVTVLVWVTFFIIGMLTGKIYPDFVVNNFYSYSIYMALVQGFVNGILVCWLWNKKVFVK